MRAPMIFLLLLPPALLCAQEVQHSLHDLKKGTHATDSSPVYLLPYKPGGAYLLVQGNYSRFSHKGEYALDFKMKKGSPVHAARNGVVLAVRDDSRKGGLKPEMISEGNYIIIQHEDGTEARYWHLSPGKVFVAKGDTVYAGQAIGNSGHTGYSAFPHLHFEVAGKDGGLIPVRLQTRKGPRYLRPGRWYRNKTTVKTGEE